MSPKPDEYQVEGYGVQTEGYDAPYLDTADFNPDVDFANAGDVEAAAKAQRNRKGKRPSEFDSPRHREKRDAKLRVQETPTEPVQPEVKSEKKDEPKKASNSSSPVKKATSTAKKTAKKVVNK